jgi:very-short-patch-repair endonuclease
MDFLDLAGSPPALAEGRGRGWGAKRTMRRRDYRVAGARRLRRDVTDAERKLWRCLRHLSLNGTHFRRQATIGPFFADFACHHHRLIIEVDGGQHNDPRTLVRDEARTRFLEHHGYRVLRFWNTDVLNNIEGVCERVKSAFQGAPTPNPSPPQAGEGNSMLTHALPGLLTTTPRRCTTSCQIR